MDHVSWLINDARMGNPWGWSKAMTIYIFKRLEWEGQADV